MSDAWLYSGLCWPIFIIKLCLAFSRSYESLACRVGDYSIVGSSDTVLYLFLDLQHHLNLI